MSTAASNAKLTRNTTTNGLKGSIYDENAIPSGIIGTKAIGATGKEKLNQ